MTLQLELESINDDEQQKSPELRSGQQIVIDSIESIQEVESQVTTTLGIGTGTPEAITVTDEALVAIANHQLNSNESNTQERREALDDVIIESAMEIVHGATVNQTPLAKTDIQRHGDEVNMAVGTLKQTDARLPDGREVAELIEEAIDELEHGPDKQGERGQIEALFEEKPELASIGTPEQYADYLETVIPDNEVPEVPYDGATQESDGTEAHPDINDIAISEVTQVHTRGTQQDLASFAEYVLNNKK